jgi:hypothetical protein
MTAKYDAFIIELKALCDKHGLQFEPHYDEMHITDKVNKVPDWYLESIFTDAISDDS